MDIVNAKKIALEMKKEGYTHREIAAAVTKKGYKVSAGAMYHWLRAARSQTTGKRKHTKRKQSMPDLVIGPVTDTKLASAPHGKVLLMFCDINQARELLS